MSFLLLIGAALLGLAAVYGPEFRVYLRHLRARRRIAMATRAHRRRLILRAYRFTREVPRV